MLEPKDYSHSAVFNKTTRAIMEKVSFLHGGKDYDSKYPEGIPTSVQITDKNNQALDSKLVMFPSGHARNSTADLKGVLNHKFHLLGKLALNEQELEEKLQQLGNLENLSNKDIMRLYSCNIKYAEKSVDASD